MARHAVLSTLVILTLVAPLQGAQIIFSTMSEPTPGLPGYYTWTVRAHSSHPMQGFDFAGDGSNDPATGKGFFGAMNQVNPFGQSTVYSDNNAILNQFPTPDPNRYKTDSQFTVRAGDVVVPAGFAEEGPNILQGIWAHSAPVGTSFDIAQIVAIRFTANVPFRGTISTLEGTTIVENNVSGGIFAPAEPASALVAGIAAVGWILLRKRTN
ncbi:MAG TPA: hypothetical protein VHK01_18865 [Lacipirellulaceae bacterium]|jgi:hypothetical protein|nr:hypothetical protein [Lacipirellulaceae bacterium]